MLRDELHSNKENRGEAGPQVHDCRWNHRLCASGFSHLWVNSVPFDNEYEIIINTYCNASHRLTKRGACGVQGRPMRCGDDMLILKSVNLHEVVEKAQPAA